MGRYFGTDGIRGKLGQPLITEGGFLRLGSAIAKVLRNHNHSNLIPPVLIGRDTRQSGEALEGALIKGLLLGGVSCLQLSIVPTPVIGFLTQKVHAMAGLVVSASHNPFDQNGLKIFSSEGLKLPEAIEQEIESTYDSQNDISNIVTHPSAEHNLSKGKVTFMPEGEEIYIEYCKRTFPHLFQTKKLKIVLDCANGATYRLAPQLFQEIGKEIITIGVAPSGRNINKNCGATALDTLKKAVIKEEANLGIAFDGDGDRLMMVDESGEVVDGDELLFILANDLKERKQLVGGVVGTVMSNIGLELALKKRNIAFARSQVGDHYVYEMLKEKIWHLGGEPSGHILNLDKSSTGDGILSALQILDILFKTKLSLLELKQGMVKYPQILINIPIITKSNILENSKVEKAIQATEAQLKNLEGRIVVRYSGTEPLLRVMLEGNNLAQVRRLANSLAKVIKKTQD